MNTLQTPGSREIFGWRAFNFSEKPVQRLAKALANLDLLAAVVISIRLNEMLGLYSLGQLEREILEAKGVAKSS